MSLRALQLLAVYSLALLWGQAESRTPAVLVVHSYESLLPWTRDQGQGFAAGLHQERPGLEIYAEFLDSRHFRGERAEREMRERIRQRYQGVPLKLIYVTDDDATNFWLRYGEELAPGVPAVFSGVADRGLLERLPRARFTGVEEWFDLKNWVKQVLTLAVGRRNVFVVTDASTTGVYTREQLRSALAGWPGVSVEVLDGSELSFEQILDRLERGPADSLVLASQFSRCADGESIPPEEASARLAAAARGPVASPNDSELASGYLAGSANSGGSHGRMAAGLALRILNGVSVEAVPVTRQDVARLVVDGRVLRRFDLRGALPAGAEVLHPGISLRSAFEQYRWAALTGLAVVLLMAFVIVLLLWNAALRRRSAEEEERSRARLESAQRLAHLGVWERDMSSGSLSWSREVYEIHGLEPDGRAPDFSRLLLLIHEDDRARVRRLVEESERQRSDRTIEYRIRRPDGTERVLRSHGEWRAAPGGGWRVFGTIQDVTELREMETIARQSQRLEAVGRLAGGVAHDFNNLLTVINGYSAMLAERLTRGTLDQTQAEAIYQAGLRAAVLTRQLLAFSRRQVLQTERLSLNEVLEAIESLLRPLLTAAIELRMELGEGLPPVRVDRALLENAVLNLAANARDAMPGGGVLRLATSLEQVTQSRSAVGLEVLPGAYVRLLVSDTGCGMDATTVERIFEPFFSTKEVGKGTGLGLASVYGTVKQLGGHIQVESTPGLGSTFAILLPADAGEAGFDTPSPAS